MSASVSDPPFRPLHFQAPTHKLGGVGQDERDLIAIGGEELIRLRTIRIADSARATRLDCIRAGDRLVTNNLSAKVTRIDALHVAVAVIDLIACLSERDLFII